jgi:hypothetical protein
MSNYFKAVIDTNFYGAGEAAATRAAEADRWRDMSVSTDVDAAGPLPALRF